jgi:hypothetical protein
MTEQANSNNPEIERIINAIPALVKFVYLKPDEELLVRSAELEAIITKTIATGTSKARNQEMVVSKMQMDEAKKWYGSIPDGLFNKEGVVALLEIGRNLIDVADALPPEPRI